MSNLATTDLSPETLEALVIGGDLSRLKPAQKTAYYIQLCKSLGLNPATQPFEVIKFQGKERMYAKKDCTDQLRKVHGISVVEVKEEFCMSNTLYKVTIKVQDKSGRYDISTGVTSIKGLSGDALCNAILKAETKAKRRATLSICGLGMLDESETDTIGKYETVAISTVELQDESAESKAERVKTARLQLGLDTEAARDIILVNFGVTHPAKLSSEQVDKLIELMSSAKEMEDEEKITHEELVEYSKEIDPAF